MKFLYTNTDRLSTKINEFKIRLLNEEIDIALLTETGINEKYIKEFTINCKNYVEIYRGRDGKKKRWTCYSCEKSS